MACIEDAIDCPRSSDITTPEHGLRVTSSREPQSAVNICGTSLAIKLNPPDDCGPVTALVLRLFVLVLGLSLLVSVAQAEADQEMRFPAPEFKSSYKFPETTIPPATSEVQQWTDVAVLAAALSLAAWLAVKRRSRRGIF